MLPRRKDADLRRLVQVVEGVRRAASATRSGSSVSERCAGPAVRCRAKATKLSELCLRWVSHGSDRGQSGIGEQLRFRIPDRPSGSDGVRSEDCCGIRLTCAERPPGQPRQHPGVTGGRVRLLVTGCRGVEQRFCPGQITEAPGDCCLPDHGIG